VLAPAFCETGFPAFLLGAQLQAVSRQRARSKVKIASGRRRNRIVPPLKDMAGEAGREVLTREYLRSLGRRETDVKNGLL
jgi:hypothetical protein